MVRPWPGDTWPSPSILLGGLFGAPDADANACFESSRICRGPRQKDVTQKPRNATGVTWPRRPAFQAEEYHMLDILLESVLGMPASRTRCNTLSDHMMATCAVLALQRTGEHWSRLDRRCLRVSISCDTRLPLARSAQLARIPGSVVDHQHSWHRRRSKYCACTADRRMRVSRQLSEYNALPARYTKRVHAAGSLSFGRLAATTSATAPSAHAVWLAAMRIEPPPPTTRASIPSPHSLTLSRTWPMLFPGCCTASMAAIPTIPDRLVCCDRCS